ncbi:DUF2971 domain-containing protein [Acidithiobacillus ferriphilus]|uniref:DUF2971 domain-containing protein n=1 Tax=Acidithiobacillus ferriphilus TaxID=1689834 RepID=UPI00390C7548
MALFYRLRTMAADRAIDEIKDEYLYFSSPDKLNDPMESYIFAFWQGDLVVWKNLFRHYLLCLDFVMVQHHFGIQPSIDDIVLGIESISSIPARSGFIGETVNKIFSDSVINEFINNISARKTKVYEEELVFYLDMFKDYATSVLINSYQTSGTDFTVTKKLADEFVRAYGNLKKSNFFDVMNSYCSTTDNEEKAVRMLFMISSNFRDSIRQSIFGDINDPASLLGINMLSFSGLYVRASKRLLFPKWATVSFMKDVSNPVVWSHYGASHEGMCMIFETNQVENKECLRVLKPVSYNGDGYSYEFRELGLEDVKYSGKLPEVDFFANIGMLPTPQLMKSWYTFDNDRSCLADTVGEPNSEIRHRAQWDSFNQKTLTKLESWAYEKESRLVCDELFKPLLSDDDRKLKFDISQLKGVVFGLGATVDNKIKIRNAVLEKNRDRDGANIDIYQAYYDPHSGLVKHFKLPV